MARPAELPSWYLYYLPSREIALLGNPIRAAVSRMASPVAFSPRGWLIPTTAQMPWMCGLNLNSRGSLPSRRDVETDRLLLGKKAEGSACRCPPRGEANVAGPQL